MSDSQRTPDASADAQQRAGATENYGGVPISEQELAQVWTTGDGQVPSGGHTTDDTGNGGGNNAGNDTVSSADPGEAGDTKPEVPQDDPAPTEPS